MSLILFDTEVGTDTDVYVGVSVRSEQVGNPNMLGVGS